MRVFVIVCQHERKVVENIELRSRLQGQQVTVTEIAKVKKNSQLCCWRGQFCMRWSVPGCEYRFCC